MRNAAVRPEFRSVPLNRMFRRVKDVGHLDEAMLSVYRDHGVVLKDGRDDNFNKTAEDRSIYQRVDRGWLVVNRMKAWQGSVGVSFLRGIVSGHYICFEPIHRDDSRFLNYLLRSGPYTTEFGRRSRGVRPSQIEIDNDLLASVPIRLPELRAQRAIADFLDAETARIDSLLASRSKMLSLLDERFESAVFVAVTHGLKPNPVTKSSGLGWIDSIPAHWGTPSLSSNFELSLGKMLNAETAAGPDQHPYLRNTNIQWDRIEVAGLALMHFGVEEFARYGLKPGDVLICEGGEVGRAAVWNGQHPQCFIQKAVHRARPRVGSNGRFLMYCLRAAAKRSVFAVEGNQSTIVHLTGEQLRVHRFPWPPAEEQRAIVERLDAAALSHRKASDVIGRQVALLLERKQALITAAVTGQLDLAREISEEAS